MHKTHSEKTNVAARNSVSCLEMSMDLRHIQGEYQNITKVLLLCSLYHNFIIKVFFSFIDKETYYEGDRGYNLVNM